MPRCRNKRQHVCFISRRIAVPAGVTLNPACSNSRAALHAGHALPAQHCGSRPFLEWRNSCRHFHEVLAEALSPSYWNLKLLFQHGFHLHGFRRTPVPGRSADASMGLPESSMQPRRVADALEARRLTVSPPYSGASGMSCFQHYDGLDTIIRGTDAGASQAFATGLRRRMGSTARKAGSGKLPAKIRPSVATLSKANSCRPQQNDIEWREQKQGYHINRIPTHESSRK